MSQDFREEFTQRIYLQKTSKLWKIYFKLVQLCGAGAFFADFGQARVGTFVAESSQARVGTFVGVFGQVWAGAIVADSGYDGEGPVEASCLMASCSEPEVSLRGSRARTCSWGVQP